jgi:thiamine-phosphate diphosphorylase
MCAVPRLHLVTDDEVLGSADFPRVAGALLDAGSVGGAGVALHVRGPRASGRRLYEIVSSLAEGARAAGALLVVNDRVDIALAADLPAVQLGRRSLPVAEARRLLGPGARIGLSTHAADEAARAAAEGADWIFAGTIYATPSHPGRAGCGPEGLPPVVAAAVGTPVLAIGGVTPTRVAEVLAAGAHGVAVVRGVWRARDPAVAARAYLEALAAAQGGDGAGSGERP